MGYFWLHNFFLFRFHGDVYFFFISEYREGGIEVLDFVFFFKHETHFSQIIISSPPEKKMFVALDSMII